MSYSLISYMNSNAGGRKLILLMTELSEAVSEKDKIIVIKNIVLNMMNKMAARVHRPASDVEFGDSAMSSVNTCKTQYLQMLLCSQTHVSNPTRGSIFRIITFIGLIASQGGKRRKCLLS
jgi:hypothetical protein